jgi:tetratricopeptide (TPR) repeat protein
VHLLALSRITFSLALGTGQSELCLDRSGGIMKTSIVACALVLATSSLADRELGDLGGVGNVQFENSCSNEVQGDLMRGHALLHSMFYDEAIAVLNNVAAKDANCAMAHWGVAMAYYHPLWSPPTPEELKNGAAALAKAKDVENASQREKDFIAALEVFYKDAEIVPHPERAKAFEKAMGDLASKYPNDVEAQAFHALMLLAVAPPGDQTFANQKAAGEVLEKFWVKYPDHPGLPHYIIHAYDYPAIADKGLAAARRYGKIAPFVPHATHMPAHIFSRLSMWKDSIEVNRVSVEASKAYAAKKFPDATFGQELHNMDYIVYAHLQMGQSKKAKEYVDQVVNTKKVMPETYDAGVAAAVAFTPARYYLELKDWTGAASLDVPDHPALKKNPFAASYLHFARAIGMAKTGKVAEAKAEVDKIRMLRGGDFKVPEAHCGFGNPPGEYWPNFIEILALSSAGVIAQTEGQPDEAVRLLTEAANRQDAIGTNLVSPGTTLPARELLAEVLLEQGKAAEALTAFETTLKAFPGRFNAMYGAGVAASKAGKKDVAKKYLEDLLAQAKEADDSRTAELKEANKLLAEK